jgi:hypothetical protein
MEYIDGQRITRSTTTTTKRQQQQQKQQQQQQQQQQQNNIPIEGGFHQSFLLVLREIQSDKE